MKFLQINSPNFSWQNDEVLNLAQRHQLIAQMELKLRTSCLLTNPSLKNSSFSHIGEMRLSPYESPYKFLQKSSC